MKEILKSPAKSKLRNSRANVWHCPASSPDILLCALWFTRMTKPEKKYIILLFLKGWCYALQWVETATPKFLLDFVSGSRCCNQNSSNSCITKCKSPFNSLAIFIKTVHPFFICLFSIRRNMLGCLFVLLLLFILTSLTFGELFFHLKFTWDYSISSIFYVYKRLRN